MPHVSTVTRHAMTLVLLLASVLPASAQLGRPEGLYYKSWGVIIAIDDYLVAPKLRGSVAGAKAVAEGLRRLGFEELMELYDQDASFRSLQHLLTYDLLQKVGRHDRVVLFFAGHAGTTADREGKDLGYLVPWDAPPNQVRKSITMDQLKEFAHRLMAKHVLLILDTDITGWDVTPPSPLSLEGRLSPEEDTEKRAFQVLAAGRRHNTGSHEGDRRLFVETLLTGLRGAADTDKNGWLMAGELGPYVIQRVEQATGGAQHPQFARLDGEGDMILIEGKTGAVRTGSEPATEAEGTAAAVQEYENAFSILQQRGSVEEALARLDNALHYNPAYGDAYVLKSYVYLDLLPQLDDALAAAHLAVKHAATNPDSFFTLGLIFQRKGRFSEAERAFLDALKVKPTYSDVYLALGDLYAGDLKDPPKSIDAYRRYVDTGGTDPRAKLFLEQADGSLQSPSPR